MGVQNFTYDGDPSKSDGAAARFYTGDVVRETAEIDDKEIAFALTQHPEPRMAAAICLDQLAARYAKRASFSVGQVSKQLGEVSKNLSERANELRGQALNRALPTMGVQTISGQRALEDDVDAVQPNFSIGRFDNPQAAQIAPNGVKNDGTTR